MKKDKLLEQAISECESFLLECRAYNTRINESYTITPLLSSSEPMLGDKKYTFFYTAGTERGILKARSLLLIRKLQAWRKGGSVE